MKKIVDLDEFGKLFDKLTKRVDGTKSFNSGAGFSATMIKHWLLGQPDAEEKQQKAVTYKDVFFEAFPGARKDHRDGMPCFEACHIWPNADFKCDMTDCGPCWSKEYPGGKEDGGDEMG